MLGKLIAPDSLFWAVQNRFSSLTTRVMSKKEDRTRREAYDRLNSSHSGMPTWELSTEGETLQVLGFPTKRGATTPKQPGETGSVREP